MRQEQIEKVDQPAVSSGSPDQRRDEMLEIHSETTGGEVQALMHTQQ
jgi:hypothetical protein